MWYIFGLINILVVLLFAWFFNNKIKDGSKWTLDDKCSFCVFLFLSLVCGPLFTLLCVGVMVYLIIDFIKYNRK